MEPLVLAGVVFPETVYASRFAAITILPGDVLPGCVQWKIRENMARNRGKGRLPGTWINSNGGWIG